MDSVLAIFLCRLTNQIQCREHPDAHLIEDYHAGDMICSECGLVVGDRLVSLSCPYLCYLLEV